MSREYREAFAIKGIRQEDRDTKTFTLDRPLKEIRPGQFLMVNVPGIGERPFSPCLTDPLAITVRRAIDPDTRKPGKVTSHMLDKMDEGDRLEILGPKGNSFLDFLDPGKSIYLLAGGCGGAPLLHFASQLKNPVKAFIGAASPETVLFQKEFEKLLGKKVFVGIDEPGQPGMVVEILKDHLEPGIQIFMCGPRMMLKFASLAAAEIVNPENIIISTEPIMKCGRGMCRSCEIGGYCACQDGPNFTYEVLKQTEYFQYRRTKSTMRMPLC